MAYRPTELGTLVVFRPEEAKEKIKGAIEECGGNAVRAAKKLAVSRRQLDRWIVSLGLVKKVARVRRTVKRAAARAARTSRSKS